MSTKITTGSLPHMLKKTLRYEEPIGRGGANEAEVRLRNIYQIPEEAVCETIADPTFDRAFTLYVFNFTWYEVTFA